MLNKKKVHLSIIIVYYNTPKEIVTCLNSINKASKDVPYEVIIVNNNSPKPLPASITKNRAFKKINNAKNVGYGKAINQAAKMAKGKYLLILNPDTICLKDSIDLMVEKLEEDKKIGVIGPQLVDKYGNVLHSIGSMPKLPDALFVFSPINKIWPNNPYSKRYLAKDIDRNKEQETDTVGGAAMIFRKKVFDEVKGFDERFFMYFEEADICYRLKHLGYKILYYPSAKIIHLLGRSTSDKTWIRKTFEQSRYEFFKKYYGIPIAFICELFLRKFNLKSFY